MLTHVAVTGSQTSGATLKMEMSQEGFRAAYLPGVIQKITGNALENNILETQTYLHTKKAHMDLHRITYIESRFK